MWRLQSCINLSKKASFPLRIPSLPSLVNAAVNRFARDESATAALVLLKKRFLYLLPQFLQHALPVHAPVTKPCSHPEDQAVADIDFELSADSIASSIYMTVVLGGYALYHRSFQISNNRSAANNEPAQSKRPVPLQDAGLFVFFRGTVFDHFVLFASIL